MLSAARDGWRQRADVLMNPLLNASLAFNGVDWIFCTIGGTSNLFFRYTISTNTWTSMANLPGTSLSNGTSIAQIGSNLIFAARSGSTQLLRYTISSNTWETQSTMPLDFSAGNMVYTGGDFVFLGTIGGSSRFWRYTISTNTWAEMAAGSLPVFGSFAYLGGDFIYSLRGNSTTTFARYSISANAWTPLAGVPEITNTGFIFFWGNNHIIAATGRNTNVMYLYNIATNSWAITTPSPGLIGTGGAVVLLTTGRFFAQLGANTPTFWEFIGTPPS